VMLNHLKSVVMVFLCSFGFSVWCLSACWLFRALFFGHLFFGTGSSENCLNRFSGKREVSAAGLIRNPFLGFQTSNWICQNSEPEYQNYDSFRFSNRCLLFVNQSRVNLGSGQT
ncbi:hypothetical protein ACSTEF_22690, partial [Vibrio vulnificus]|uniref:hypothetical protein n=1 Tax=Vibrio vulnificus TaxID=672 RepID=UPI003EDAE0C5